MSESVTVTATVVQVGPDFQYNLTLNDVGPTAIGGLWIAWVPGIFLLPNAPTATSVPSGWTANPFGNSVQYSANSPTSYVQSGGTLSGFSFTVPDAPSVIFGQSAAHPGTAVLSSFAYETSSIDPGASDPGVEFVVVACLAAGTRILTAAGETTIEQLRTGDLVPTLTGDRLAAVHWLGRSRIDCRVPDAWPVRIATGAFGPGRPARPLKLSPDHAVHVDGALIPIRRLLNGATVVQQLADHVEYWHLELHAHAVVLAEGLPVESYLDTGNRAVFTEVGTVLRPTQHGAAA